MELDPVIHVPTRLRLIVSLSELAPKDTLTFTRLQDLHGLTAGNLITHLRKLQEAGYVAMDKGAGRSPVTTVALTDRGRVAFDDYRAALRALLADLPDTLAGVQVVGLLLKGPGL